MKIFQTIQRKSLQDTALSNPNHTEVEEENIIVDNVEVSIAEDK